MFSFNEPALSCAQVLVRYVMWLYWLSMESLLRCFIVLPTERKLICSPVIEVSGRTVRFPETDSPPASTLEARVGPGERPPPRRSLARTSRSRVVRSTKENRPESYDLSWVEKNRQKKVKIFARMYSN